VLQEAWAFFLPPLNLNSKKTERSHVAVYFDSSFICNPLLSEWHDSATKIVQVILCHDPPLSPETFLLLLLYLFIIVDFTVFVFRICTRKFPQWKFYPGEKCFFQ
jgi:hypothetical protein